MSPLEEGSRASEDQLAGLHHSVAQNINSLIDEEDPRIKLQALKLGIQFLHNNRITASATAEPSLNDIASKLPSPDELEKLMALTVDEPT